MSEFKCSLCNYKSSQKIHVIKHITKVNKCGDNPNIEEINIDISCEYCKKDFKTKQI